MSLSVFLRSEKKRRHQTTCSNQGAFTSTKDSIMNFVHVVQECKCLYKIQRRVILITHLLYPAIHGQQYQYRDGGTWTTKVSFLTNMAYGCKKSFWRNSEVAQLRQRAHSTTGLITWSMSRSWRPLDYTRRSFRPFEWENTNYEHLFS